MARNHLGPDGFSVDDDFFAQLGAELFFGEIFVSGRDDASVQKDDAVKEGVEGGTGVVRPWRGGEDGVADIVLFELGIGVLVVPIRQHRF